MKPLLVLLLLVVSGCSKTRWDWVEGAYPGDFPTHIGKTWRTPTGISVEGEANPHEIDWYVDTVFECLKTAVPDRLTHEESRAGACFAEEGRREPFQYPRREDLVVKIGESQTSCAGKQVLKVRVPESYGCDPNKPPPPGCELKGCWWRGGYRHVDGRHVHIEVEELSMFPDTLTRHVTACHAPYLIKRIRHCAKQRKFME